MTSTIMKDSKVDDQWLREMMQRNPPSVSAKSGNIISGPVRLSFPNLFQPGKARTNDQQQEQEPKYGAALLFPPGTNMAVFEKAWLDAARTAFPKNWTPDGKPVNLHSPFHAQDEKAYGAKPLVGYTPGGVFLNVSSKFKPQIVDAMRQPVIDESKVYPGVWAIVSLNVYHYKNLKTGVGFGIQTVMLVADDVKLGGVGGNPEADFEAVQLTATANVAEKFDGLAGAAAPAAGAGIMPTGGHVGRAGSLPTHALPGDVSLNDALGD